MSLEHRKLVLTLETSQLQDSFWNVLPRSWHGCSCSSLRFHFTSHLCGSWTFYLQSLHPPHQTLYPSMLVYFNYFHLLTLCSIFICLPVDYVSLPPPLKCQHYEKRDWAYLLHRCPEWQLFGKYYLKEGKSGDTPRHKEMCCLGCGLSCMLRMRPQPQPLHHRPFTEFPRTDNKVSGTGTLAAVLFFCLFF